LIRVTATLILAVWVVSVPVTSQQSVSGTEHVVENGSLMELPSTRIDVAPFAELKLENERTESSLYDSSLASEANVSAMSGDHSKFALYGFVDNTHTLYIADLMNRKLTRYDLPQKDATNAIMDVEWIDDNTLGVEGHINPYICSYYMLNISSGVWSEPLHGLFFTWTAKGLFYAESVPFSNGGKSIISADGTAIYAIGSEESDSIIEGLWFNAKVERVIFFERNHVSDKITLVVATLDGINPLHIDKRIPYEGATGAIEWTGDNQIEIIDEGTPKRVIIKLE
jgi:hypothetical protein